MCVTAELWNAAHFRESCRDRIAHLFWASAGLPPFSFLSCRYAGTGWIGLCLSDNHTAQEHLHLPTVIFLKAAWSLLSPSTGLHHRLTVSIDVRSVRKALGRKETRGGLQNWQHLETANAFPTSLMLQSQGLGSSVSVIVSSPPNMEAYCFCVQCLLHG